VSEGFSIQPFIILKKLKARPALRVTAEERVNKSFEAVWIETANLFLLMNSPEFLIFALAYQSIDPVV
jgi:hypothetical protein